MNRKQFVILLVLGAVIGGIGLMVYQKNDSTYQGASRAGQKLLGDFNVNDVAQIAIKENDKELTLVKGDKVWTVKERGNYPANFEQISEFVRKAQDLKVVQTIPVGPSQLGRLELAEPGQPKSGMTVQFKGATGQEIKKFQLGAKHMKEAPAGESQFGGGGSWPDGRYVLADKSGNVAVVSDPLTQASTEAQNWLNKDFFKVEKTKLISVAYANATNSWGLRRKSEGDAWKLDAPQAGDDLDTNKVSGIANALSSPSFTDVATGQKNEETGLDQPTVLTLETFDGFKYVVKVGKTTPEDQHYGTLAVAAEIPKERVAIPDEKKEDKEKLDKEFKEKSDKLQEKLHAEKALEGWVYLIPKWTLESVLKNRADLMVEKKDEKKEGEATTGGPAIKGIEGLDAPPSLP